MRYGIRQVYSPGLFPYVLKIKKHTGYLESICDREYNEKENKFIKFHITSVDKINFSSYIDFVM